MSQKIDSIVRAARALSDPAARKSYLDEACRGDEATRARVEAILQAEDPTVDHVSTPGGASFDLTLDAVDGGRRAPLLEGPGTRLGPYLLLERIGEGGFGTVYLAEQREPIARRVALKIIKPGMEPASRRALRGGAPGAGGDDHPNRRESSTAAPRRGAALLRDGVRRGQPITNFCDEHRLDDPRAARAVLAVCDAVQHAHQKGIIHRDIKPSNVLVVTDDGQAVASRSSTSASPRRLPAGSRTSIFVTAAVARHARVHEPGAGGAVAADIDTRTDVYSLGVILYELLTGRLPFDPATLQAAGWPRSGGSSARTIRPVRARG